jgi:hypothetical protein
MSETNMQECPYCSYKAEIRYFSSWKENGKSGLLGKTDEGFVMLLCPSCESSIKFDPLVNSFLKNERKSSNGIVVSLTFAAILALLIFFLLYKVF